ncbi:universal stress protein [Halorientalis pallida]|uniref:Universal stress protein n=1 Tax=Halorientalis pallida TaxID=2479928 RepID=A0A498L9E1_9EURY|nr:universal stress protein [Halorientalis pallida]RXK51783.1 universal stress protein [Halorientalis pallida]
MADLFERVLLPVASPDDATGSARALRPRVGDSVVAVHVVEKAGGAVDKASVEQREEEAGHIFEAIHAELDDGTTVETEIAYGTDVAETVFDVADEIEATSIVFTPRGGSRWIQLLTGDVALDLITGTDRPVVVLPDHQEEGTADESTGGGEPS